MDRPYVTIHNLISLDGFLDGFPANGGLYYELVGRQPHQAVLPGQGYADEFGRRIGSALA